MTINMISKHLYLVFVLLAVSFIAMMSACKQGNNANAAEMAEINRYIDSMEAAQSSGNYQELLNICKEFYEKSKKGHSDLFRASAASIYGQWLVMVDDPDKGKVFLDEALQLSSENSSDTLMMELYVGMGMYEQSKHRNFYAASEYYLKALEHARRCEKRDLLAVLCNLGNSLSCVNDTTGFKYIQEAYEIAKETGNSNDMMDVAMCMANQMKAKENTEELLKWKQIYMENLPPARRVASENMIKAEKSLIKKNYAEANQYIDIAVAASDTTKNIQPAERKDIYVTKATILYELGKYKESIKWLDKESELYSNTNDNIWNKKVRLYAMNYEKLGDNAKALEYRMKQLEDVEEKANVDRINILKAKEVALGVAQKDEEIARHKELARIHYWMIGGVLLFCIILMGLCLFIYNMYRRQRKLMSVVVERAPAAEEKVEEDNPQVDERFAGLFQRMKVEIEEKKLFKDQNLSRDGIASLLGTNRSYITDATKMMTGMSFPQYISSLRISEAERLLQNPKEDVSNLTLLGESLGFSSLSAFQSTFKKYTGMTLSAYREIARKKRG